MFLSFLPLLHSPNPNIFSPVLIQAADDQDDVDLPTCSQIISKGLPILNPTDVLVKKHTTHQGSRIQSWAASLTGQYFILTQRIILLAKAA